MTGSLVVAESVSSCTSEVAMPVSKANKHPKTTVMNCRLPTLQMSPISVNRSAYPTPAGSLAPHMSAPPKSANRTPSLFAI